MKNRGRLQLDAFTTAVAALSIMAITVLLIAAAGIAYIGTRPLAATLPPARLAVRFADLVPASVAAAAPAAGAATAEAAVVPRVASPLQEWLTMEPVALPDWHAIELAAKDPAPGAS